MGPPKSGNSDSKYTLEIFKNQKLNTYIRRPQIKKFYKTGPPKVGIVIQNTILKFSNTKNQTQKRPPKFPKIKNIYKEASNQKVLKNQKFNSKSPPKKKKKKKKK